MYKNQFVVKPQTKPSPQPAKNETASQNSSPTAKPRAHSNPNAPQGARPAPRAFGGNAPTGNSNERSRGRFSGREEIRAENRSNRAAEGNYSPAPRPSARPAPTANRDARPANGPTPRTLGSASGFNPNANGRTYGNAAARPAPTRAPINPALRAKPRAEARTPLVPPAPPVSIANDLGVKFQDFKISPLLLQSILEMKYTAPSPIQAQTIPAALEGHDVLGCAQTGTGKTAAFLIPLVSKLLKNPTETALVLAPTRELADQIQKVLEDLTANTKHLGHALLIGGMSMDPQMRALRKNPRVLIATPGRLVDHIGRRSVNLSRTSFLVLDEADRMLDMGFAPQLREILKVIPKQRQTLLFTATLPPTMRSLAQKYLYEPVEVSIGATSRPIERIDQESVKTTVKDKNDMLLEALNKRDGSVIIFARTQRRADRLYKHLVSYGHEVGVIHGGKTQGQRNRALSEFRESYTRILVATDVASRGIDIPHVAHVINYDLPEQPEDYVHRIGRTARAGNEGNALSMITPEEAHLWKKIQQLAK